YGGRDRLTCQPRLHATQSRLLIACNLVISDIMQQCHQLTKGRVSTFLRSNGAGQTALSHRLPPIMAAAGLAQYRMGEGVGSGEHRLLLALLRWDSAHH